MATSDVVTQSPLASAPLSRFLRVDDAEGSTYHDALWDLKHALALQCVFIAGCCRRSRELGACAQPGVDRSSKRPAEGGSASELVVAVIGGGVIGGVVAHALLDAGLPPSSVLLSTRTPLRQKELTARGASVFFDNALAASRAHLLILAVLQPHLQDVARSLRPRPNTTVLSLVGATPLAKIRSMFGAPRAIDGGAGATLPLLLAAQAQRRAEAEQEAAAAEEDEELDPRQLQSLENDLLTAGRLPNTQVARATKWLHEPAQLGAAAHGIRNPCSRPSAACPHTAWPYTACPHTASVYIPPLSTYRLCLHTACPHTACPHTASVYIPPVRIPPVHTAKARGRRGLAACYRVPPLTCARLPPLHLPEQVLQVAAEGFACDASTVARHIDGLRCVVSDLELPSAVEKEVCVAAYFGQLQPETLSSLVQQLSRVDNAAPPAPSARAKAASPAVAAAGVGALPEGGVEGGVEGVVLRARAAFEARLGQSPVEEEEEEDATASPAEAGPMADFDS